MSIQTGNHQLVKKINKNLVLDMIIHNAPISRADISQKSGLNKGTVSSLVTELMDEQLILESGPGKSSGGRRPVMLLFNERAGFSIGIDLGVNYILGVLTDLKGKNLVEINRKLNVRTYDEVLTFLKSIIQELMQAAPKSPYGIVGIGIGVPGLVDHDGRILTAPNFGWKNQYLKRDIENEFNIPVIIENEASAGAYGEKLYGAGNDSNHMLYVSAGIGIGVGIIINGELYSGKEGFSGEFGHTIIQVNGKDCPCGSSGCWELYASEKALLDEAKRLSLPNVTEETLSIELLDKLAKQGNEDIINLFNTIGTYLAVGINNIIHTFNPDKIIIGNRLVIAKDWLKKPIEKFINKNTMKYHQDQLDISFSKLTTYSSALGVSALSIESFLKSSLN